MVEALNKELFNEAKQYIPGGVNSPVRAFGAVGGYPIFVKQARGSKIYDAYNREFIDYCMSWGALILGHTHPEVIEEINETIKLGTSFGMPTKLETDLAKVITEAIPSLEKIRLTNSGTEAVMGAVRLARAFTQKEKIIKFAGSYHGHADYLLNCPGIPKDFTKHTLVCPYNDIKNVEKTVKKLQKTLAAIIVEPVAANTGVVLPQDGFLEGLRKLANKYHLVLIFDEVITGFRLSYSGAQGLFGIRPDLTCLGKIVGGGLPCGAFGGRQDIMKLLAPEGPVYQAGTFSGNPLTVSAGLATLKILARDNPYKRLEEMTRYLCEGIKQKAEANGFKINPVRNTKSSNMKNKISNGVKINFIGSMFSIYLEQDLFKRFYHGLLKEGIYFAPSSFEANFLSTAHKDEDIGKTIKAIEKIFTELSTEQVQGGKQKC